jgi:polar amino acid transport system substrate-binding protein
MTSRRHLLTLAAALPLLGGTAHARPLDQVLSTKRLRAGINPTLPPMGLFNERNQIDGFDADIAREIARRMGVELEIVQVGSPDRIPFLPAGPHRHRARLHHPHGGARPGHRLHRSRCIRSPWSC